LCSTYATGPPKVATVTTDPSAVRTRETETLGTGGGGAGRVGDAAARLAGTIVATGPDRAGEGAGAAAEELHAAVRHKPASAAAARLLRVPIR
jgi:hypothetical protein